MFNVNEKGKWHLGLLRKRDGKFRFEDAIGKHEFEIEREDEELLRRHDTRTVDEGEGEEEKKSSVQCVTSRKKMKKCL